MAPEVPPPGEGFVTVTNAVPAFWRSDALTCAVTVVEFIYEVAKPTLFHSRNEEETKFDPLAVIVSAELPAAAEDGLIEVSDGTGFGVV
jgi:hypothetical protein